MITKRQNRGFMLAIKAGEIMMKSGGEIYRVEEVITRICRACDITHVEVFATPTGIFASIGSGGENGDTKTYIKAIHSRKNDLQKISDVNNLSRQFVNGEIDVEDAMKKLVFIEKDHPYPIVLRLCGAGVSSALFCLLFGGSIQDGAVTILVGMVAYITSLFLTKYNISYFITDFCACSIGTFLALLAYSSGISSSYDYIIIGMLMLFVPGAAITNAFRDFLTGDMLSGVARLTEAFAIALSLAVGAGFMIKLWTSIGGGLI